MGDGELAKTDRKRPLILPAPFLGDRQRREQAVQRPVLAEEEQLLLAAEVVIQVPRREVGGDGDVAHAGGGEAAGAEHAGGGAHDFDTAGLGAFRTTVRRLNHGSILAEPGRARLTGSIRRAAHSPRVAGQRLQPGPVGVRKPWAGVSNLGGP